jgi:hypothetical protein
MVSESVLKVYQAFRSNKLPQDMLFSSIKQAIKLKATADVYTLSRAAYARADENLKQDLTVLLATSGYREIIPFPYLKKLKDLPKTQHNLPEQP